MKNYRTFPKMRLLQYSMMAVLSWTKYVLSIPALVQAVNGITVTGDKATVVGFSVGSITPIWKWIMEQWDRLGIGPAYIVPTLPRQSQYMALTSQYIAG